MGMAASQARLLGLTARKTNVEYEGQQINQQRTSLANQSSAYYNQLLSMNVPTPPSTDSFSKIVYTFPVPEVQSVANITQITKDANGTYTVSYNYATTEQTLNRCSDNNKVTVSATKTGEVVNYSYSGQDMIKFDPTDTSRTNQQHIDTYAKMYSDAAYAEGEEMYYIRKSDNSYMYFRKSAAAPLEGDLPNATGTEEVQAKAYYYTWGESEILHSDSYSGCTIVRDSNNRIVSFSNGNTELAVNAKTEVDNKGYEDAYNEYTYATYLYEKEMQDINGKIEIVQGQDKTLELRLKALDTEQKAISSEMEALKGVLDKNMEAFKTFA